MEKYLYSRGGFSNDWYRTSIRKETDNFVWISTINGSEIKISKKTYRTGDNWNYTYYYQETPGILKQFEKDRMKRVYRKRLEELQKCEDENIMRQIIEIKIPIQEEVKQGSSLDKK
jgi:hypothetical protein